jgi:Amt family ammonium transporter
MEQMRFAKGALPVLYAIGLLVLSGCSGAPTEHLAAEDVNAGDTAFMLICAALVMLMTPALGLFYGGLVRTKNVLSVLMHCVASMGLMTVLWVLVGYSLAFSPSSITVGEYSLLGGLDWAFLGSDNVGYEPHTVYASTIPHKLFMIFQCMFAIITPAIICGAFAERMKFKTYLVFISVWLLLVYVPVCHWVWSENGWLLKMGSLDFAGGTVVHMTSGLTALVVAIMIKPRRGFPREAFIPHNLVFTLIGAALLWFGWFGFNAGSAVSAGRTAAVAFASTHCAAAAGALAWIFYDWMVRDKPTLLGAASGAVAGLVAVTPAAGFVSPLSGFALGAITGMVCAWVVGWRARKGIDDALDAFGIHGVGGALGAILTGVFASNAMNSAVAEDMQGLIYGNGKLLLEQVIAVLVTLAYTVPVSFIILKVLDMTMGLRVSDNDEQMGLDLTQHGEAAYNS